MNLNILGSIFYNFIRIVKEMIAINMKCNLQCCKNSPQLGLQFMHPLILPLLILILHLLDVFFSKKGLMALFYYFCSLEVGIYGILTILINVTL